MTYDVLVLGAGMVGVSTALHLQARGQKVALIDRRAPGEEASYGNAGVIERDGLVPLTIPKQIVPLLKYASNREVAMHYHPLAMPRLIPWLWGMWCRSNPKGIDSYARRANPLRANAAKEHLVLADEAGIRDLFREDGWLHLYHNEKDLSHAQASLDYADEFGVDYDIVGMDELEKLEPSVRFGPNDKAIFWKETVSVSTPGGVTKAYADMFVGKGGDLLKGDAQSLKKEGDDWVISSEAGAVVAPKVVVALGAWSMDLLRPMGYSLPLAAKRGYHQHFASLDGASLTRPIVDEEIGFLLTPMEDGIRLTTGIEFADRDARKTPIQVYRATEHAREIYPLGAPVEDEPWMGSRPCFPDSLPVVEASQKDKGLYLNFGHAHMGFATGPVTGRILAEMIVGETPFLDPAGLSSSRF